MMKQGALSSLFVAVLPLAAFASTGAASNTSNIGALPEAGTLGLLGAGLIGYAVVLRRKLRLTQLDPIRVPR